MVSSPKPAGSWCMHELKVMRLSTLSSFGIRLCAEAAATSSRSGRGVIISRAVGGRERRRRSTGARCS
eukprot:scaffold19988_cov126-Isochrysis_galbana.AAC.3